MIIACPECGTRYVVPETAIGGSGRTVRCAKCKHSWFQEPELEAADTAPAAPAEPDPPASPSPDTGEPEVPEPDDVPEANAVQDQDPPPGPSVSHWRTQDYEKQTEHSAQPEGSDTQDTLAREPDGAFDDAAPDPPLPSALAGDDDLENAAGPTPEASDATDSSYGTPYDDDDYVDEDDEASQFDYQPPFAARRNPLKMWTAAAVVFSLFAAATIAAVNIYGLPSWAPFSQPTFGLNQSSLQLEFPEADQERRTLPSGTEYFEANGTVTNIGTETVALPPIRIVLRDERERVVYDWRIAPPVAELAPGESVAISEAKTDVPRSARYADIGWSPN